MPGVEARLRKIEGVREVKHTHLWSLDGERHVLATHLVIAAAAAPDEARRIKVEVRRLRDEFGLAHTTVEIDFGAEDCTR